ncbi:MULTISPECIES: hypothetical protein [unclassified Sporolactobacillus]|uniref:hypothetical protein n=1 Tax=unclassified Sporolactobacillus TaxID=2628533 RepID=UPI00236799AA|nr:hypothetical protein [Sporolactobacillus sp. CQH2019]MDD9147591.1 hypothetical protein [Sporolactobacillus sp. CQH2019]
MGFASIIFAVIILLFYVARSVEKQNAQERARRAARSGRRTAVPEDRSHEEGSSGSSPEKEAGNSGSDPEPLNSQGAEPAEQRPLFQETSDRLARSQAKRMAPSGRRTIERSPAGVSSGKSKMQWAGDRRRIRRAFIFAVCIGKPRALEPHQYFGKQKSPGNKYKN